MSQSLRFCEVETDEGITKVAELAATIWREHYPSIIGEEQVEYMLQTLQSFSAISTQCKSGIRYFLLHEIETDEPCGYLSFHSKEPGELFLSKIYLLTSVRGRGFARATIEFVKEQAVSLAVGQIRLTVNKDNIAAHAAYERMGFRKTGSLCVDIGEGFVMDDWEYVLPISCARKTNER